MTTLFTLSAIKISVLVSEYLSHSETSPEDWAKGADLKPEEIPQFLACANHARALRLAAPDNIIEIFTDEDGQIFIGYEGEELLPLSSY